MQDHISICVCTYKRQELLKNLLQYLLVQTIKDFSFEIVVVDNDKGRSAESTVKKISDSCGDIEINYFCQPEQNIALARNLCIQHAKGNYVAFIDDDEIPVSGWLLSLVSILKKYNADAVFGPVIPRYPDETPTWIINGEFFERKRFSTGTIGNIKYMAKTGNALVKTALIKSRSPVFDPKYGITGGEDTDFFGFLEQHGAKFVWSDEAIVYEHVLSSRLSLVWILKRKLRCSQGWSLQRIRRIKRIFVVPYIILRTFLLFFILLTALLVLPLSLFISTNYFYKILCQVFCHIGHATAPYSIFRYKEYKYLH